MTSPPFIIGRYHKTSWSDKSGGFHIKESIIPLRRETTPQSVGEFADDMREGCDLLINPELKNNDKCTLRRVVTSTDFETGYADDWHWVADPSPPKPPESGLPP